MKRREFLRGLAGTMAGTALLRPLWWPAAAQGQVAGTSASGRILILVTFQGGNDGINTVIPYTDPVYPFARPTLRIAEANVLPLSGGMGFHPALAPLMPLWDAGRVAVVQGVGYPDMNLSHFRGTDIMFSASDADQLVETGWMARWLESANPDFPQVLPEAPYALQQGFSARLPLNGERGTTGVVVDDPQTFSTLVDLTYEGSTPGGVALTKGQTELSFVQNVDFQSFEYAQVIADAAGAGENTGDYPRSNFGTQISTIARMIEGNMDTPVFLAAFNGFDTHGGQQGTHDGLLDQFAQAMNGLFTDLDRMGRADDVVVMTVSEFGRRVDENGALGTDHGTSAPWFLIGNGVQGGLHGTAPALEATDPYGNLLVTTDYRSVYATVLQEWFGTDATLTAEILGGEFGTVPAFVTPAASRPSTMPVALRLEAPRPNPGRGPRVLRFALPHSGDVDLSVFDVRGRRVARVVQGGLPAGSHETVWDPGRLASGIYFVTLRTDTGRQVQKLVIR